MTISHAKGRGLLLAVALLASGCASSGPPIAGYAGEKPKATAIVTNHDNVFVLKINGRKPRSRFALAGDQSYEIAAGPTTLEVEYRNGQFIGIPKTLKFTALRDHRYRLNSYVKPSFHGYVIATGGWDARLEDLAEKGKFVAETRDAR